MPPELRRRPGRPPKLNHPDLLPTLPQKADILQAARFYARTDAEALARLDAVITEVEQMRLAVSVGQQRKKTPVSVRQDVLKRAVATAYGIVGTITRACSLVAVPPATHYRWVNEDEEYKMLCLAAEREFADRVEDVLYRAIMEPGADKTRHFGNLVIAALKGTKPWKHREHLPPAPASVPHASVDVGFNPYLELPKGPMGLLPAPESDEPEDDETIDAEFEEVA